MRVEFLDNSGNPLVPVSVNGTLKLYTNPGRLPYTGGVRLEAVCDNDVDPCKEGSCSCCSVTPYNIPFVSGSLQALKDPVEGYVHSTIKQALNFEDTLPGGECSGQKLNIFLPDGIIYCVWHLEDGWNIDAIVEVPFCQPY